MHQKMIQDQLSKLKSAEEHRYDNADARKKIERQFSKMEHKNNKLGPKIYNEEEKKEKDQVTDSSDDIPSENGAS